MRRFWRLWFRLVCLLRGHLGPGMAHVDKRLVFGCQRCGKVSGFVWLPAEWEQKIVCMCPRCRGKRNAEGRVN